MPDDRELFRRSAVEAQNVMHGKVRVSPPPSWTMINALLIVLVAGALLFSSLADYARTVTVTGEIQTQSGDSVIRARNSGVAEVLVKLGDRVEKGDPIIRVELQRESETGNVFDQQQGAIQQEISSARLRAEAAERAGNSLAQAAMIRSNAANEMIATLSLQLEQVRIRTKTAEADLERARQISERGFLSKRDLEQRENAVALIRQEESSILERIASARGQAAAAAAEARQASEQARIESAQAYETISRAEQISAREEATGVNVYRATRSGRIASLPIRNGQTVEAGESLVVLIPEGERIIALLEIPSAHMTSISEGQKIKVSVHSYPYQTYGLLEGEIQTVARAAIQKKEQVIFLVEASIPETITVYGKKEQLLPGMSLSARVVTQERSLLEWLLDPLFAVTRR